MISYVKSLAAVRNFGRHYLGGLWRRADEDHVFLSAAGLAFSFLVCTIPFVLIVFAVLVHFLQAFPLESLEREIGSYIDRFVPYEQYAAFTKEIILSRLETFLAELQGYKGPAVMVGVIGLLFAVSGLFSSMRTILNRIYRGAADKPAMVAKARDLGMILLVLVFFVVSTMSMPVVEVLKSVANEIRLLGFFRMDLVESIAFRTVSLFLALAFFFTLYHLVPYARLEKRVSLVSALWATILWELARLAFGYYISNFASLKRIYGTYVLLVVVVFWTYYSAVIFIIGAEIGQLFRERRQRTSVPSTD